MKNKELISIIIPVYNTPEKLLKKCLISIMTQTYQNLEIIIVDDGSNKKCVDYYNHIIQKDKRVKVIRKENTGVSDTRNKGLEESQGTYIMFVDSDDFIDENYVCKMYENLKSNKVEIIVSGFTLVDEKFSFIKKVIYNSANKVLNIDDFIDYAMTRPYFTCVKMLFRKEIVSEKFNIDLKYGEDFLFAYKLMKKNKVLLINDVGYYYVQNKRSVSYSYNIESTKKYLTDNLYLYAKLLIDYPNKETLINNRIFTKLNISLSRYIQSNINYSDFLKFVNSINEINYDKISIKEIDFVNKLQKLELKLLYKKKFRLYYTLIKLKYKIRKII